MLIIGTDIAIKTEDMVVNIHNQLDCYVVKVNEQVIYKSCHRDMVKDVYDRLIAALSRGEQIFCVEEYSEKEIGNLEKVFM